MVSATIIASLIGAAAILASALLTRGWCLKRKPRMFPKRDQAKISMLDDIQMAVEAAFLGISHTSLSDYLGEVMGRGKSLPIEQIQVYFARDDVGASWEGARFALNILESIYRISVLVSAIGSQKLLHRLKSIVFLQSGMPSYYGGSLFRKLGGRNRNRFNALYVVHYLPLANADAKTSYTMRLTSKSATRDPEHLFVRYLQSYKYIQRNSDTLFRLDFTPPNLWDISIEEWDEFEERFPVYQAVMAELCKFAKLSPEHTVVDIGCGTGRASKVVAEALNGGSLLLLDSSPQMMMKARKSLGENGRIIYILSDARARYPLYGAAKKMEFDRVFLHFSFHHFVNSQESIESFARSWRRYLKPGGEIDIAIHNTCVVCDRPDDFLDWKDPLREQFKRLGQERDITVRAQDPASLTVEDIESGFRQAGFDLLAQKSRAFHRTMEDRCAMWKAPAVMNSLLNVRDIRQPGDVHSIADAAYSRVKGEDTMPMTVVFLRFSARPQSGLHYQPDDGRASRQRAEQPAERDN